MVCQHSSHGNRYEHTCPWHSHIGPWHGTETQILWTCIIVLWYETAALCCNKLQQDGVQLKYEHACPLHASVLLHLSLCVSKHMSEHITACSPVLGHGSHVKCRHTLAWYSTLVQHVSEHTCSHNRTSADQCPGRGSLNMCAHATVAQCCAMAQRCSC